MDTLDKTLKMLQLAIIDQDVFQAVESLRSAKKGCLEMRKLGTFDRIQKVENELLALDKELRDEFKVVQEEE